MTTLVYRTAGADTHKGHILARCPICSFPLGNGFQLTCAPGVCLYREKPVRYRPKLRRAA